MRNVAFIVIAILLAVFVAVEVYCNYSPEGKWVDCRLMNVSPDFTPEMRQACREFYREQAQAKDIRI